MCVVTSPFFSPTWFGPLTTSVCLRNSTSSADKTSKAALAAGGLSGAISTWSISDGGGVSQEVFVFLFFFHFYVCSWLSIFLTLLSPFLSLFLSVTMTWPAFCSAFGGRRRFNMGSGFSGGGGGEILAMRRRSKEKGDTEGKGVVGVAMCSTV